MYEEEAGYYAQMVMEVTKRLALGNWLVWCVSDVEENSLAVKMVRDEAVHIILWYMMGSVRMARAQN